LNLASAAGGGVLMADSVPGFAFAG